VRVQCIIFGGGGHAKVVIECLKAANSELICAILDQDRSLWGQEVTGVPVLGDESLLQKLVSEGARFFVVAIGSVGDSRIRRQMFEKGVAHNLEPFTVIHPNAIRSPRAIIGPGTQLMPGSIVNVDAQIGKNVIVNTGVIIEHDCRVGDHVHLATGAVLAGGVTVGHDAHIGCGATVRESIFIGDRAIVGAGSLVIKDVPADAVVTGVPAKPRKRQAAAPLRNEHLKSHPRHPP
jgi:sugar O-acyltransferase (sialic acid O-acetyltransferase NeuD family)